MTPKREFIDNLLEQRRDCGTVITRMLAHVPVERTEFIADLKWNQADAAYKAPEETLQWQRTMNTLMKHIPEPTEQWEFEVLSIFTTQPISVLRAIAES